MMEWSLRSLGEGPLAGQFSDLGRRSASGLVLAVVALGLAYAGGVAFSALILVVGSIMSWEWGRIVRRVDADMACLAHAAAIVVATTLAAAGQLMFAGISLAIGTIAVLSLAFHRATLLSALGVLYVGVPAVLLVTLRGDLTYGLAAVTFVMLLVWSVDTGAFLGGRSIGGPKLWPSISPNKTWAGFISGVAAGVLVGAVFSLYLSASLSHLLLVALLLGIVSQGGDLAESALKREFGVKDSSWLIPGHGGFLDRLDGVVAAATLAGLIGLVANIAAPARALLFGA